jgi:hypothetical protein
LNPAIKILVIDRVFIMPNPGGRVGHFVGNEGTSVGARDGLDWVDRCSSPGIDGRGHPYGRSNGRKAETRRARDGEPAVRRIVVHVALPGMGLAPSVLMRSDVLRFGVVRRAWIQRGVQVAPLHQKPVRYASFRVARVLRCTRWKGTGKRIHPSA